MLSHDPAIDLTLSKQKTTASHRFLVLYSCCTRADHPDERDAFLWFHLLLRRFFCGLVRSWFFSRRNSWNAVSEEVVYLFVVSFRETAYMCVCVYRMFYTFHIREYLHIYVPGNVNIRSRWFHCFLPFLLKQHRFFNTCDLFALNDKRCLNFS